MVSAGTRGPCSKWQIVVPDPMPLPPALDPDGNKVELWEPMIRDEKNKSS